MFDVVDTEDRVSYHAVYVWFFNEKRGSFWKSASMAEGISRGFYNWLCSAHLGISENYDTVAWYELEESLI